MSHTPGPWLAFRLVDENGVPLRDGTAAEYVANCIAQRPGEDFFCVAQPGEGKPDICHTGNGPTSAANAAFIVRACNSHEELLAALNSLVLATERADNSIELGVSRNAQVVEAARAAIAKATG